MGLALWPSGLAKVDIKYFQKIIKKQDEWKPLNRVDCQIWLWPDLPEGRIRGMEFTGDKCDTRILFCQEAQQMLFQYYGNYAMGSLKNQGPLENDSIRYEYLTQLLGAFERVYHYQVNKHMIGNLQFAQEEGGLSVAESTGKLSIKE